MRRTHPRETRHQPYHLRPSSKFTSMDLTTERFNKKLNYVPTEEESIEIAKIVSHYTHEQERIESEISRLNEILDVVREAKMSYQAILSPMRRLPSEILQAIFVYCLPIDRNSNMRPSEAPILLGHVCSRWRALASGTPALWAALHIVSPVASNTKQEYEDFNVWLTRSGAVPLKISLLGTSDDSYDYHGEWGFFQNLLEEIRPFMNKLQKLEINATTKNLWLLCSLTGSDVPLLETLSIIGQGSCTTEDIRLSLKFAADAPRLHSFSLSLSSGNTRVPTLPWSQIRHFSVETQQRPYFFLSTEEILRLYRLCPNLESFTYKIPHTSLDEWDIALHEHDPTIVLPHLHTLCIDGHYDFSPIMKSLRFLETPELRSIEVFNHTTFPLIFITFHQFLERSSFRLSRLSMHKVLLNERIFMDCLPLVPSLVELVLSNCVFADETWPRRSGDTKDLQQSNHNDLDFLVIQPGREAICSALKVLELPKTDVLHSTCCRILDSRSNNHPGVANLRTLRTYVDDEEDWNWTIKARSSSHLI